MKGNSIDGIILLLCGLIFSGCVSAKDGTGKDAAEEPEAVVGAYESADPFLRIYGRQELQEDFNKLKGLIENVHPQLYADRKTLAGLLADNYALITEGMTELEFLRLLSPIVSVLNCGHTSISLSPAYQRQLATRGKYFPLPLRFIKGKAFVEQNGFAPGIPVGTEILGINGKTTGEIIARLMANLSSDGQNETHKYMLINGWFRYRYQNFIDSTGEYEISYRIKPSGEALTAKLAGVTNDEWAKVNQPSWPAESGDAFSNRFEEGYAVLGMYSFYPEGRFTLAKYKNFIDSFFRQVMEKEISDVILDVRNNGGGDPYVTSHLFNYLAKTAQPYFSKTVVDYYTGLKSPVPLAENRFGGKLYVLMDGGSFSSTGHLLALLKYQEVGTFIGEESGASFACTDASADYSLQNTGIQYRSSTLVWDVAVTGLTPGRGIMPDYEVVPAMQDYMDKRDVVMEYAVGLISQKP